MLEATMELRSSDVSTLHTASDVECKLLGVFAQHRCSIRIQGIFSVGLEEEKEKSIYHARDAENRFPVFAQYI